ncbi:MAG: GGDEF domain-containing protein [Acidobacteriaceae bacterium]|nr:GGDEF domain-containing protein [Acidobacteriaceae bacterium]
MNQHLQRLQDQLGFAPNILALLLIVATLLHLQKRRPRIATRSWLLALAFLILEQCVWLFIEPIGVAYRVGHTITLECNLGVAVALFFHRGGEARPALARPLLWLNALPAVAMVALYGAGVPLAWPYYVCAVVGAGVALSTFHSRGYGRWTGTLLALCWLSLLLPASTGDLRGVAYRTLGFTYGAAAIDLWRRMYKGSGRLAMCASLAVGVVTFFTHSWVIAHRFYQPLGEEIWTLQRFVLPIGMLIVLLEGEINKSERLALFDMLTGVANRRYFEEKFAVATKHGAASLLLLDLNGFKQVNDTFGHSVGDELLQIIAQRLLPLAADDEVLCRLGGDEFAFLSPRPLDHLREKVRSAVRQPVRLANTQVQVAASIGVATLSTDCTAIQGQDVARSLFHLADSRMYEDKQRLPLSRQSN